MAIVFISLGSNLGDRSKNITRAVDSLKEKKDLSIVKISSISETEPDRAIGPNYLNMVVKLETKFSALNFLKVVMDIETKLGRVRLFKNAPRIIDLDILLYDNEKVNLPELTIPHPRMLERVFVMDLLLEVEPEIEKILKQIF